MRHVLSSLVMLVASVPAFASVDSGLLALAPSGAKMISGIDVNRARSSPFGQFVLSKMNADDKGFNEMIQETGFDPRRDVQDALIVSNGPTSNTSKPAFAVLVRGNFDQDRIKNTLLAKGATVQPYQGVSILLESSSQHQNAFAFLDVDIAAMGDLGSVQQMIGNRANPTSLDPALQQLVSATGASSDAWFASLGSGSFLANNFRHQAGQQVSPQALQSILQSSGGVSFGDVVQLSFDAVTRSPQDATSLVDVVRFGASMMQMQRQQNSGADVFAKAIDNMTLNASGSNVHVGLSIPEASLEQIAELKHNHRSGSAVKTAPPAVQ